MRIPDAPIQLVEETVSRVVIFKQVVTYDQDIEISKYTRLTLAE